jgi:ubiquinone/menaquinone biosynthesis C-methylase UbiE
MRRYNLTAQMYDARYCEEQEAKYAAALDGMSFDASDVVLDVGCGSGMFFSRIANKVDMLVGADVSRDLLPLAKLRSKSERGVCLVLADADYLPFREKVFSHVFAFTLLQNVPKPVQTLLEFKVVSKRDACFVVTGLKAAFSLESFGRILDDAGMHVTYLKNDDVLRCYIVRAIENQT